VRVFVSVTGPLAFANAAFRRLLHNALRWVSSADARAWARAKSSGN